jgi:hypothetical protein
VFGGVVLVGGEQRLDNTMWKCSFSFDLPMGCAWSQVANPAVDDPIPNLQPSSAVAKPTDMADSGVTNGVGAGDAVRLGGGTIAKAQVNQVDSTGVGVGVVGEVNAWPPAVGWATSETLYRTSDNTTLLAYFGGKVALSPINLTNDLWLFDSNYVAGRQWRKVRCACWDTIFH